MTLTHHDGFLDVGDARDLLSRTGWIICVYIYILYIYIQTLRCVGFRQVYYNIQYSTIEVRFFVWHGDGRDQETTKVTMDLTTIKDTTS